MLISKKSLPIYQSVRMLADILISIKKIADTSISQKSLPIH
jgi:hypothetical protein